MKANKKFLLSLFILLLLSTSSYSEMRALIFDVLTDSITVRDTSYNFIKNKEVDFIWKQQQKIKKYLINKTTGNVIYGLKVFVRVSKKKVKVVEALLAKATTYFEKNSVKGAVKIHACYNDSIAGDSKPCKEKLIWQK